MRIFAARPLSDLLEQRRQAVMREIQDEPQDHLLNVNETAYVKYLFDKYHVDPLTFAFDAAQASSAEKLILAKDHPREFHLKGRQSYSRHVITFHVPFTGEPELLHCEPSTRILWTYEVTVAASRVQFEVINWRNDREALDREKQRITENIVQQNAHVTEEVTEFNARLEDFVRQAVSGRKSNLLSQLNVAGSLGIPLEKGVPQTFAIPIVPKRIVVKPAAPATTASPPDPTLDNETYQNILSIIHAQGVAMERQPSTYKDKDEEDLRDIFLATLCTHYPSSTGETFNKKGRTDILIRYQGSNVFVGECKFWGGLKTFHGTIDQLMTYLTWRDSKAAVVSFVKNTQFNPVLQMIKTGTLQHPCFIRLESTHGESWTQFEFRLPSDPSRNVHLAVLCFHFPPAWIDDM
jgi:hypothetical protein